MTKFSLAFLPGVAATLLATPLFAQASSDAAELQKQLSNPVASLISVPFQFNFDDNIGPKGKGERWTMNIQPVIPFDLGGGWNLISRTIVPVVSQYNLPSQGQDDWGLGDTTQSFFFSPAASAGGLIWGVGPAFLFPTATEDTLGLDTFAAGVTGVVLKQNGPWTLGVLANHLWDWDGPVEIDSTFTQPFLAYAYDNGWTATLQAEWTHDWVNDTDSAPIGLLASKLGSIGGQPVSWQGGVRYYADSAPNGPEGWGARFGVTLLFPK
ncbi:hypothetical protein CEW88_03105 [Alloyangia pacifica]|uniref:Transporter n=1 Tax=Alloyangia pacifica TaxID=311180 RepID=A0A2U8HAJ6_9RHOB|nr:MULTISPECIES: hypothetical protein [Roseobacteraceae]AWI82743.1 hypothetical protein CEW88_03105 [Alloyangia pacifica]NDV48058.1 transporter [Salipiger sp. PrR003]NDW33250.1 transporter [Salipiger sp. PrR007]